MGRKRGIWIVAASVLATVALTALVLLLWPWEKGPEDAPQPMEQVQMDQLVSLEFSRYSGAYVEDGSDEKVSGVAAMLVANPTDRFLDLATVTYQVGEKTAVFEVKGLPPGGKAWVLESQRMTLDDGDTFQLEDCVTTFRADAIRQTDLLSVQRDGNSLTVKNVSGETLENVCLYYKVKHTDGNYLGGILYTLNFGTLEAGASQTRQAGHFSDRAEIVRYSYQIG